jgi:CheY-like chemotaxis protein
VYSERELGTTFKIYLPAATDAATRSTPSVLSAPPEQLEGTETVLLCEDEDLVLGLLERILAGEGYELLSSRDPHEALALAASRPDIDLLLTDVILPGLSGPELAARLRETHPDVRTLFLSGYSFETVRDRGNLPAGSAFLEKPFDRASLLRRIRELLDLDPRLERPDAPGRSESP